MTTTTPATQDTELPGSDLAHKLVFTPLQFLVSRLWNVEIEGLRNIPASGPAILTPNHLSFCDSVFVPTALERRCWAIGKGEYMDSWKTRYLFSGMGMIPVDRSGGDAAMRALDTAAKVLQAGHLFMIYPEGTRSRSGNLHKGRTGPARLALRCDAPVIPVGHEGTVAIQPPDYPIMKPFKDCTVRFGEPMWVQDHGDPNDPRTMRAFTDAVMFEIAQLSGQQYVDTYANAPEPEPAGSAPATTPITRPKRAATPVGRPPGRAVSPQIDLRQPEGIRKP